MKNYTKIHCPQCNGDHIIKSGLNSRKVQRYRCMNKSCSKTTFLLEYAYKACSHGMKNKILDMAINGSGVRDTARVLKINMNTVMSTLKKSK